MSTMLPNEPLPNPSPGVPEPAPNRSYLLRRPASTGDLGVSPKERILLARHQPAAVADDPVLRGQIRDLERLLEMSTELTSILEPEVLFTRILDFAVELTSAEKGLLMREEEGELRGLCARNQLGESIDLDTQVSRSLTHRCLKNNDVILWDSVAASENSLGHSLKELNILSVVCVPLQERGTARGVLYLESPNLRLVNSTQSLLLLRSLASHASVALANASAHRDLENSRQLLTEENEGLKAELRANRGYGKMIGQSTGMIEVYEKIELLKDTDVVVMIQGETGTGKELVARALHEQGSRRDRPFVPVNCGSIVESLIESLMFGYVRGAFTNAYRDTPGWLEVAGDGTLFLDEIADLPLPLQVNLLRVLDGGGFQRVGEQDVTRPFNARVIVASHADLRDRVAEKKFREDLYYRLSVARIDLPPLRTRREDIPALTDHFVELAQRRIRRRIAGITPAARTLLLQNPWKGNVRELQHVIEAAAALVPEGGIIDVPQIQAHFREDPGPSGLLIPSGSLEGALAGFERGFVERTVSDYGWNISAAAKSIGVSRQHLHNLIRKHQLSRPAR